MKIRFILFGILFLLFFVSCGPSGEDGSSAEATIVSAPPLDTVVSAYPGSGVAYPGPEADAVIDTEAGYPGAPVDTLADLPAEMLSVPAPANNETGTVTGVLLMGEDDVEPVKGAILYLGQIVTIENNTPALASLNKQLAPTTQTSQVGQFIFTDIPVGQYALVYDLITATFVLNNPVDGGDLIVEVTNGDIIDLGGLHYDQLPVLNQ